jgi:hypothetical protein
VCQADETVRLWIPPRQHRATARAANRAGCKVIREKMTIRCDGIHGWCVNFVNPVTPEMPTSVVACDDYNIGSIRHFSASSGGSIEWPG